MIYVELLIVDKTDFLGTTGGYGVDAHFECFVNASDEECRQNYILIEGKQVVFGDTGTREVFLLLLLYNIIVNHVNLDDMDYSKYLIPSD